SPNEDGWRCPMCDRRPGEPPGFDPKLDREDTYGKVGAVLHDMHEAGIVHVSSGSHGDSLTAVVAQRCHEAGLFDQYTIARFVLESMQPSHAKYWREVSDGVLAGKDPRHRCPCGELSTSSSSIGGGPWI